MALHNYKLESGKQAANLFIACEDDVTAVWYHKTCIVKKTGKRIVLNTGGWRTPSTQRAMNTALSQMFPKDVRAPRVGVKRGLWRIEYPSGYCKPFEDGIAIEWTVKGLKP